MSVDIDMKDVSRRGPTSSCDPKMGPEDLDELREDDGKGMEFPTHNLYELEQRGWWLCASHIKKTRTHNLNFHRCSSMPMSPVVSLVAIAD